MTGVQHFDQMYQANPDPWGVASAWYERRKRALMLASLPRERYQHGFEPGCGNGQTTQELLQRCDRLCAVDFSEQAIALCSARFHNVERSRLDLQALALPAHWPAVPASGFDLIVVSELAYYFDAAEMADFYRQCLASLRAQGHLVMCHWQHDADDRLQSTAALHQTLASNPQLRPLLTHAEVDFELAIWQKNV